MPDDLSAEIETDILAETGNVVLGACVGTLVATLGLDLSPSLPEVIQGTSCEVLDQICDDCGDEVYVLLMAIDFRLESREIDGYLTLVLDVDATDELIAAVDRHVEHLGLAY